eukprot:GHVS01048974.1.p4 GENE.GHVS01048974.1~~GHVS01048974.1.p4  ORF type:complete len:100 (+),score=10.06 GHVS01048974.1:541-840(+)
MPPCALCHVTDLVGLTAFFASTLADRQMLEGIEMRNHWMKKASKTTLLIIHALLTNYKKADTKIAYIVFDVYGKKLYVVEPRQLVVFPYTVKAAMHEDE